MKKTTFTLVSCLAALLLAGCATSNTSAEASRVRTAYVVPSQMPSNSQEQGFYWPVFPTLTLQEN